MHCRESILLTSAFTRQRSSDSVGVNPLDREVTVHNGEVCPEFLPRFAQGAFKTGTCRTLIISEFD
jgi:hypothetical protein